jgi:hypothetical protein
MAISNKLKAGCGVSAVFGLGFFLGAFALLILIVRIVPLSEGWKSEESKRFIENHFAQKLKLSDEQREQFRPILEEALDQRWDLRRQYLLDSQKLLEEEYYPRISEILTEEQQAKAGKMLERWNRDQKFKIEPRPPEGGSDK